MTIREIEKLLGDERGLLTYKAKVPKTRLTLPSGNWIDQVHSASDRPIPVLRNLASMFNHGRLSGTGYLSILPVDQGIEHTAGASFAPNPDYFDPENIIRLAIEGGCNAVASTLGVLGMVSRKYSHRIPMIMKFNHNELLSYPNTHDQTLFASVDQAFQLGAVGVGATIYFGSPESRQQIVAVSEAFEHAHTLGMFTVLWCYVRNREFRSGEQNLESAADLTGQANHLGATIQADIVKQKSPESNFKSFEALSFGKAHPDMYRKLSSDNPIDMTRYQVLNAYAGKVGLINSGGDSGKNDLAAAVRTAVINKRAGGMGLISGRKTFQKSLNEGIKLFHAIQDVYLAKEVTIA